MGHPKGTGAVSIMELFQFNSFFALLARKVIIRDNMKPFLNGYRFGTSSILK